MIRYMFHYEKSMNIKALGYCTKWEIWISYYSGGCSSFKPKKKPIKGNETLDKWLYD